MSRYTIIRRSLHRDIHAWYSVLNPSGVAIATGMSWRTARKVCDLLNADRDNRRSHPEFVKLAHALLGGES